MRSWWWKILCLVLVGLYRSWRLPDAGAQAGYTQ